MKVQYVASRSPGGWRAHGRYLIREGAQREGARGLGFDASGQDVAIEDRLGAWQKAGDRRLWKVILSPEEGNRLDLREHTRELVAAMEADLGTRLEWVAIDDHNTAHPHVHVAIRGRDEEGRTLAIPAQYVRQGIRARSQELASRQLGYRTAQDRERARERAMQAPHFGELDALLERRAGGDRMLSFDGPVPAGTSAQALRLQLIGRLRFLESLGLAEQTGTRSWRLAVLERATGQAPELPASFSRRGFDFRWETALARRAAVLERAGLVEVGTLGRWRAAPGALEQIRTLMRLRDRIPMTFAEVQRISGKPIHEVTTTVHGMIYRGRLVAYAEDGRGEHFAMIDEGRQVYAVTTTSRDLAPGKQVRARLESSRDAGEASERERRRGLVWQLVDLERERDRGRGR